jgi:hypothetical protein
LGTTHAITGSAPNNTAREKTATFINSLTSPVYPQSDSKTQQAGKVSFETDDIKKFPSRLLSYAISRWGTTAALNQDRTAIYHNGLPSAESFLHQKQIRLRYVMSLADSANRETLSNAFV